MSTTTTTGRKIETTRTNGKYVTRVDGRRYPVTTPSQAEAARLHRLLAETL